MTGQIKVFNRGEGEFVISWDLEGDLGLSVGEERQEQTWEDFLADWAETETSVLLKRTWWECERLAREDVQQADAFRNEWAICWSTRKRALEVLSEARKRAEAFIWKQANNWPEWAIQARKAGWRPPRGWTPDG